MSSISLAVCEYPPFHWLFANILLSVASIASHILVLPVLPLFARVAIVLPVLP
jgi:hypothetical protein